MKTKPENCADSVYTIWKSSTSLERGNIFAKISPMMLGNYKKHGIFFAVFFCHTFQDVIQRSGLRWTISHKQTGNNDRFTLMKSYI